MPLTAAAKNLMLNAFKGTNPAAPVTHAGLFTAQATKSITGVASTDIITATAHGYANGDLVLLAGLAGGAGLVNGDPYFVINQTANTFQLSKTVGGSAADFTSDITGGTVQRLVEVSGGSPAYARVAIAYANAVDGVLDDSTNGAVFNVPGGTSVDYASFHSAITAGTLLSVRQVTSEVFAGQGTYTLTDSKFDLNG